MHDNDKRQLKIRAKIVRHAASPAETVHFEMRIPRTSNQLELAQITRNTWYEQSRLGYHPSGYGGPNNTKIEARDDSWIITWECWGSCD